MHLFPIVPNDIGTLAPNIFRSLQSVTLFVSHRGSIQNNWRPASIEMTIRCLHYLCKWHVYMYEKLTLSWIIWRKRVLSLDFISNKRLRINIMVRRILKKLCHNYTISRCFTFSLVQVDIQADKPTRSSLLSGETWQ